MILKPEILNQNGSAKVVLICDHASNVLPEKYGTLAGTGLILDHSPVGSVRGYRSAARSQQNLGETIAIGCTSRPRSSTSSVAVWAPFRHRASLFRSAVSFSDSNQMRANCSAVGSAQQYLRVPRTRRSRSEGTWPVPAILRRRGYVVRRSRRRSLRA